MARPILLAVDDDLNVLEAVVQDLRRQYGATGHSITRVAADPNTVVIVNDFATLEGAQGFAQDPTLPAAMARGGVEGPPQVWIGEEADAETY